MHPKYFSFYFYMLISFNLIPPLHTCALSKELVPTTSNLNFIDSEGNDLPLTFVFAVQPLINGTKRTLLARSDYSNNNNVFEINELANNSLEVKLFMDSENYLIFTSEAEVIPNKAHSIMISYNPNTKNITAYVSARKVALSRTEAGIFTHLNKETMLPITSYVIDSNSEKSQYVNSNVGVVSIIKKALTDEEIRAFALTLEASMGNNPCIQTY